MEAWVVAWLRTRSAAEIKKSRKDFGDAIKQLATYLRQILREQHDRRFVFGFIFCGHSLSVWYCDRSGLLGTRLFDIDKVCRLASLGCCL